MSAFGNPKIVNDGLVFMYDANNKKSYKGRPTQNLWDDILNTQSLRSHTKHYWNGRKWIENSTYSHPGVRGPKGTYLGIVLKHTSGSINSTWSGNSYGYMLRDISCTSGSTFTQSCWVYVSEDCDVDGIPSVIEGESGGETTVTGYSASYDLTNKGSWQVIAKRATSDGYVRFIPLYPRKNGVTDGSFTGFFMWALPQVVEGSNVVRPIQPGETRSATNSLKDRTGNSSIDISNASFDSDMQMTFDGTDDYVTIGSDSSFNVDTRTVEITFRMNGSYSNFAPLAVYANGTSTSNRVWLGLQNSKFQMHGWGTLDPTATTTINADTWYTCVWSYDLSTQQMKMYTNGVLEKTLTNTQAGVSSASGMNWYLAHIPGSWQGQTYSSVDIKSFKIYDRILTDDEVAKNFNAKRSRFGL